MPADGGLAKAQIREVVGGSNALLGNIKVGVEGGYLMYLS